ncbi:alpha/beta fold hydrolase [Streptomyces anthocyanicus]|uniref:alpha/beta fold hydrolase n=1 Tax=Streptomyces anthocyanicus TaxID=68174 RepID=UPI003663EFDA
MGTQDDPSRDRALRVRHRPPRTRAAVLVLHGGRAESRSAARPWQLAALRMHPFLRALEAATGRDDVLLGQVRYRNRGWNGAAEDPLRDARRALAELHGLVGDVPVVLLGHSMGGRAALRAADADPVRGVVALAPWCPPGEPVAHLRDRALLVLHGSRDRVTDPGESAAYVSRARAAGARAGLLLLENGDHAMLRHHARWHRTATAAVAHLLAPEAAPCELFARALSAAAPPVLRSAPPAASDAARGPVREPGC